MFFLLLLLVLKPFSCRARRVGLHKDSCRRGPNLTKFFSITIFLAAAGWPVAKMLIGTSVDHLWNYSGTTLEK